MDKDNNALPETEGDFGPDLITLTDEDGVDHTFELVDVLEHKDENYVALLMAASSSEEFLGADGNLVIMKIVEEDGEEILEIIEDDDEFEEVSEIFMERLADLYEFEDGED